MFIGKLKLMSGLLATAICFFSVISGNAVGDENAFIAEVLIEEARLTTALRSYAEEKRMIKRFVDRVFCEIGAEHLKWLRYCSTGDNPRRDHPELYYLWLAEKFDKLSDVDIRNEEFRQHIAPQINAFVKKLLERVQEICPGVYCYYGFLSMSAYDIANLLVQNPSLYPGGPLL